MITTLYLITVVSWISFRDFDGEFQARECQKVKEHIERNFEVEGTCVSKDGGVIIHNNRIYGYAESRKQGIPLYTRWDGSSEERTE